jgi:choline dehydrogenase-like flavoprotein
MATSAKAQTTDFTKDSVGRFVFNGFDEAIASTDTSKRPDARPFDIIVLGGGTFGSVIAQHLFFADHTHSHRILVLEGGPFVVSEHVQNMPMIGLNVPGATSIADLRAQGQDQQPREEVWGLAWHSSTTFPGLAYCVGGRSVYFGGWSPRLLDEEMPTSGDHPNLWPKQTVDELTKKDGYFDQAAEQIGIDETNDFINGALHEALRQRLFDGIGANKITGAIPIAELQNHLRNPRPGEEEVSKLDAPLAVQSQTRSGFFPFNKFSAMPLIIKACRSAYAESSNDDVKKRLMVVPECHVQRLIMQGGRVSRVETNRGSIDVPGNGIVILALATIESARLAMLSFQGIPNYDLIGRNLMAHLRSNMTIRMRRDALPLGPADHELQASALFVKGRHTYSDGDVGHFHLQITAAGLPSPGGDSEAELFKKIPDIDQFDQFKNANDQYIVITLRGIGEMQPQDPQTYIRLDGEPDEFGQPRAFVSISPSAKDLELWDAMDQAAKDAAAVFAGGHPYEILSGPARDILGTTHHEAGTLWMGDDPTSSVVDGWGNFHEVENAYVVGPAQLPSIGSPNPMLSGVALARRTADRMIQRYLDDVYTPGLPRLEAGFRPIFDGTDSSFRNWRMVGGGSFALIDGALVAQPWGDIGLLYYGADHFADFTLKLQFRLSRVEDNSGVFVRFQDPLRTVPRRNDPTTSDLYNNQAFVAVDTGFEIQIDETAAGDPPGQDKHRTGAIYNIEVGPGPDQQDYRRGPNLQPGVWNDYEIQVVGQTYTARVNGQQTTTFTNTDPYRGAPSAGEEPTNHGFLGLQSHTGQVAFRAIRIRPA